MATILLRLDGMHSTSDNNLVEEVLQSEPAIKSVEADFRTGVVRVTYNDERISVNKLKWLIQQETDYTIHE